MFESRGDYRSSLIARMAELVYAHDLKSCLERDVGSSPTLGTKYKTRKGFLFCAQRVGVLVHSYVGNRKTEQALVYYKSEQ